MPVVGMPVEDPDTAEDFIIESVVPAPNTIVQIPSSWEHYENEALPLYSDVYEVTARPARNGEVAAWHRQMAAEEAAITAKNRHRSWWERLTNSA
jgi:hypothetical protein